MTSSLLSTLAFSAALTLVFFVPGWLWWRALFGRAFSVWETLVYAFLLSLTVVDALMLLVGRMGGPLDPWLITGLLAVFACAGGILFFRRRTTLAHMPENTVFSKHFLVLFLLLAALTLFVRTLYLADNMLPTTTDMGHHAYWAKVIAVTETLPRYEKSEVVFDPVTGSHALAAPQPIADFIVGEHLPLALLSRLTGLNLTSALPFLFLHVINLLSVLACVMLAYRIGQTYRDRLNPEVMALAALLLLGPLFALASPQARFVSGGVVGNIFGNLFIPAVLLLLFRGFSEKRASFLAGAFIFSFALAYTHHLSTLVLAFAVTGIGLLVLVLSVRDLPALFAEWRPLLVSRPFLLATTACLAFFLLVAVPSYIDREAIDSAIGTPTKTTRTGLSFSQVTNTVGLGKMAFGLVGLLVAGALVRGRNRYASAALVGWGGMLLVMALFPHWLFLDIPSGRIGSYLAYAMALFAAFALAVMSARILRVIPAIPVPALGLVGVALAGFLISNGAYENAGSLNTKDKSRELVQTFAATEYLARHSDGEIILKDHNYLAADAWMKLFFLRDYGYPLSRGLFGRYEEGGNRRERCTLAMISTPNTAEGEKCYRETGVRYLVVNPIYDRAQFEKSDSFSKLYMSETTAIFERK
jgi:hypothetical protein